MPTPTLILASRSPRRRQLLEEAGYQFVVIPPDEDVESGVCSDCSPAEFVAELALRKAAAIARQLEKGDWSIFVTHPPGSAPRETTKMDLSPFSCVILAADTVAECDGWILGKPRDAETARAMLRRLSGREHRVLTGVCLWQLEKGDRSIFVTGSSDEAATDTTKMDLSPFSRVAVTTLRMDPLTNEQLDDYIASGGWEGKAGAFGYQDRLGWVHVIKGSESNVVGLPMELLAEMLAEAGIAG